MMPALRLLIALFLLLGLFRVAEAHKPSDSYLQIAAGTDAVTVRWDIALRDLDFAIGLDADNDGAVIWGELKARHQQIASYALARLTLSKGGTICSAGLVEHLVDEHSDGAYAVLRFALACPEPSGLLTLDYRLFFDVDAQHRGLLNLIDAEGASHPIVFAPDQGHVVVDLAARAGHSGFAAFLVEGIHHILEGYDHLLFLAVLLLPAMLRREGGRWVAMTSFGSAFLETLKILTAFTVAHALTLSLAVLGYIDLPSRLIESAIAVTIALAAIDNVVPYLGARRWMVAFGFGLIHGVGFANALGPLALSPGDLAWALLGFNLGVEAGQVMLAAVVLPLGYAIRRWPYYARGVLPAGSAVACGLAMLWLVDRVFDTALVPF